MTSRNCRTLAAVVACALGLFAAGCLNRDLAPAEPGTQSGVLEEIQQTGITKVDMLFVIDNSNSMGQEQAILAEQIEIMARELVAPTTPETPAVVDLHIGIVSTDMGTSGYDVQTCNNPLTGDNGELQNVGRLPGCDATYSASDCARGECPWLTHTEELPDDGTDPANPPIWADFGCIATLGTGGCGFEQQLEASYAALTLQAAPGMANDGFLRDDSLLAVIYVTDEDDCSSGNGEMFNPSRDDYGNLNTRCALQPDELYPISRYRDAFLELRDGDEDRVVVAAITGVPIDGSWNPGDPIERLRDMQQVDPADPSRLLPSCVTPLGEAFPPVRIVELVYSFGSNGILASICRDDWTSALRAITNKVREHIIGVCVDRPLASTDADTCRVVELLVNDDPCPHPADAAGAERSTGWHVDLGVEEVDGRSRRRCEILASDYDGDSCPDGAADCETGDYTGALQGWFYANNLVACPFGQVRFTDANVTSDASRVRFECLTALCPERRQCGGALADESLSCNGDDDCGSGAVCVRHNSGEICGYETVTDPVSGDTENLPRACGRCSPTLGATCSRVQDTSPPEVSELPLFRAGGCCAEGFHCENGDCLPDRTFRCE